MNLLLTRSISFADLCSKYPRENAGSLLICATFLVGCFFHFFRIDTLPMGFYVDEMSIGYNAHLIATAGIDEHGTPWPLFFEAFGEYKNPLYIYLLAGAYKFLGYSEWTTRFLSAFCWLTGTLFLYTLGRRLFEDTPTRLYIALCLAFTPWVFSLSRISFEVITLYPVLGLHLLALHRGFEGRSPYWALIAGATVGLSLYAYTAFRLLAPLHILAALATYRSRCFRREQVCFVLGATILAIPFAAYAAGHFANLASRFNYVTFLRDPTMGLYQKLSTFVEHYLGYFGISFLAISGDSNRRHHTGLGGEFLISTVILLAVAIYKMLHQGTGRFQTYLLIGLLLAPIAAATTYDIGHSLRTFSMSVFAIMLSGYAIRDQVTFAVRGILALTIACAAAFIVHYFAIYPPQSAIAFESFGFREALQEALARTPRRVVVSGDEHQPYIKLRFFGSLIGTHVPLMTGSPEDVQTGDVLISYNPRGGDHGFYETATESVYDSDHSSPLRLR